MTLSVSRAVFCRWEDNGERWIVKNFEASVHCRIKVLSRNVCGGTEESHEKFWCVTATPVCSWTSDISFQAFLLRILCSSVIVVSSCHLVYFPPWLGHPNEAWWTLGLPVTKLLILLFPYRSCYSIPYKVGTNVILCERQSFTPMQNNRFNYGSHFDIFRYE